MVTTEVIPRALLLAALCLTAWGEVEHTFAGAMTSVALCVPFKVLFVPSDSSATTVTVSDNAAPVTKVDAAGGALSLSLQGQALLDTAVRVVVGLPPAPELTLGLQGGERWQFPWAGLCCFQGGSRAAWDQACLGSGLPGPGSSSQHQFQLWGALCLAQSHCMPHHKGLNYTCLRACCPLPTASGAVLAAGVSPRRLIAIARDVSTLFATDLNGTSEVNVSAIGCAAAKHAQRAAALLSNPGARFAVGLRHCRQAPQTPPHPRAHALCRAPTVVLGGELQKVKVAADGLSSVRCSKEERHLLQAVLRGHTQMQHLDQSCSFNLHSPGCGLKPHNSTALVLKPKCILASLNNMPPPCQVYVSGVSGTLRASLGGMSTATVDPSQPEARIKVSASGNATVSYTQVSEYRL